MNRFRDNYEAPGLLRTIAQWMNEVGRFLNGINVVGNGHIEENARGSVTITVGRGEAGGGGVGWDGTAVDFYGTNILTVDITDPEAILGKYIVYHTGLSPTKHPAATWPKNISEGPWAWDTEVRGSPWMSWEVGGDEVKDENGNSYSPKRYSLAKGKTCGTIRIPVPIPTKAYQVIQLGAGTGTSTTDNGILAQYPRTHEL